jgi:ribosomal protein S27E
LEDGRSLQSRAIRWKVAAANCHFEKATVSMPIEFRCPSCQQQLRVPDDSAGKNAKCPKCGAIAVIPTPGGFSGGSPSPVSLAPGQQPGVSAGPSFSPPAPNFSQASPAGSPFGDAAQAGGGNPFAADYPVKPSLNPYASPAAGYAPANLGVPSLPITNQRVEVGQVWNYAWQVWQRNLGLLVAVTLIFVGISYALAIPISVAQIVLEQNDNKEGALAVSIVGNLVSYAVQTFLGIGQAIIGLKVARQQPATVGDLFGGGHRFLPVLGVVLLLTLGIAFGLFLCIVPGLILGLMFWPCYYLVVEGKASVFDSFSVAYNVTEGNRLTTFLLGLLSIAVSLLGFLALCIGILFAVPLITVMWTTAYLMMSGQILVPQMAMTTPGYYPPAAQGPGKF